MAQQFLLLGPQGSGKGTQAKVLAQRLGIPHISTGDMFRGNVAHGTALGKQAQALIEAGKLVPDEITNQMVKERLAQADAQNGFVLDGFPRNLPQAEFLHGLVPTVRAIVLQLSDTEAVRRIAGRLTCPKCGAIYHPLFQPPREDRVCDRCGGKLIQRTDDTAEVVQRRLVTYHQETEPIIEFYRAKGQLVEIDGAPPIAQVTASIKIAFGI